MMLITFFAAPLFSLTFVAAQASPQAGPEAGDTAQNPAAAKPLTLEQSTSLRCSAAFALVAHGQSMGNAEAKKWPAMEERGREFFVRTTARLMEDTGLTREAVTELMAKEAQNLVDENSLEKVMPACLLMLDASGL
jgi:hypothetical protein